CRGCYQLLVQPSQVACVALFHPANRTVPSGKRSADELIPAVASLRSMQALCAKSTELRLPSFALDFDTHSATSHSEVSLSKLWRDAPLFPANNSSTDLDDQCLVHEARPVASRLHPAPATGSQPYYADF
ncbi:hypothetical protein HaLaN_28181, partial [Haematococcus lacustris]